jgi:hypothetical protein
LNANLAKKIILDLVTTFVDVGEVRISKTSMRGRRGTRYLIYLPSNRAYLWAALHSLDTKVRVFLQVPQESLEGETERQRGVTQEG